MSVKHAFLALLAEQPSHGYQLKQDFEQRTGGTWSLNIGQVYTTLQRLEASGLIAAQVIPQPVGKAATASASNQIVTHTDRDVTTFSLTTAGHDELTTWWQSPVDKTQPARDELIIKLALAVASSQVDATDVIRQQRTMTMGVLRDYTRLKQGINDDLAWSLVLEHLIFTAEAEIRWLDHVEMMLHKRSQDS